MKNKLLVFGTAALAVLMVFVAAACDNGGDPGTTIANLIGGKIKVGGTDIRFSVNADLPPVTARAAVGDTFTPVSGKLEYGNTVIKIEGFYDPVSYNFTFSGAADGCAFEFFGIAKVEGGGPAQAAGKIKIKDSDGVWTEELVMFDFDSSILVNGTEASSPTGLPEKWAGKWQYATEELWDNNCQMTEDPWGIMSGECVMTLGPYSIAFWFDMNKEMEDVERYIANSIEYGSLMNATDEEIAEARQREIYRVYNLANVFSIYEVTDNGDGSYDVLASRSKMEWGPISSGWGLQHKYLKMRIQEGTGQYEDELWITFGEFEDPITPGYFYKYAETGLWCDYLGLTPKEMMDMVRDGTNFDTDRAKWANNLDDPYYNLFVIKR